ncbi:MAG TPA: hypothetical protein VGH89_14285 [Pseudonocardia sp.]
MSGSVEEFISQLRALAGGAGSAALDRLPSLSLGPPPGALSAAQIQTIAKGISAQRTQISAVNQQLEVLDGQLAVLERLLEPLVAWSTTWAEVENAVGNLLPSRSKDPDKPKPR